LKVTVHRFRTKKELKTGFPVKNAYFLELLSIWLKIEVSNYFVNNEIFNRENQKLCKGGD
jgi:hypothetical protein